MLKAGIVESADVRRVLACDSGYRTILDSCELRDLSITSQGVTPKSGGAGRMGAFRQSRHVDRGRNRTLLKRLLKTRGRVMPDVYDGSVPREAIVVDSQARKIVGNWTARTGLAKDHR